MPYRVVRFRPGFFLASLGMLLVSAILLTGFPAKMVATVTQQRRLPVYSVETKESKVALGINCAWGDEDVDAILALLERQNVRASFFVTGTFCRKFPDAVRRMFEAGHEIGSHSNTHVDLARLSEAEILEQIRRGNEEIRAIIGEAPKLFRTPSGSYNDLVIDLIVREGMIPIQWDCDSIDYQDPSPALMRERIMKNLRSGSIMLFHVGAKNTPDALPDIIDAIQQKGYEFAIVGELVYPLPYKTDHAGRQSPA